VRKAFVMPTMHSPSQAVTTLGEVHNMTVINEKKRRVDDRIMS
jgi:hypothetical protein